MFTYVLSNETSPTCFYGFSQVVFMVLVLAFVPNDLKIRGDILKEILHQDHQLRIFDSSSKCMWRSHVCMSNTIKCSRMVICPFVQDPEQLCSSSEDQPGFGGQDAQDGKEQSKNTLALKEKRFNNLQID